MRSMQIDLRAQYLLSFSEGDSVLVRHYICSPISA